MDVSVVAHEDRVTTCSYNHLLTQQDTVLSFGEVLDDILVSRHLSQKQFAELTFRSESDVSRLINNRLPQHFHCDDLHAIAVRLDCTRVEFATLVTAFAYYLLDTHGLIDPELDP